MQPRTLAILVTLLPLLAANIAYLMSANAGLVPWCIPYLDGCTTISQAGRSGNTIFLFRAIMIVYAVMLIWFWTYALHWLNLLSSRPTLSAKIMCWSGITGALSLVLYIDFLGTTGEFQRFMRLHGIMIYFTLTPFAQLIKLNLLIKLKTRAQNTPVNNRVIQYQLAILLLMLLIGIISLVLNYTGNKTYETENIIEWNFSILLSVYFAGTIILWKNARIHLTDKLLEKK
jgi:hypothetical protein